MAPKTKKYFDAFIHNVSKTRLHDNDWKCFYRFSKACCRYQSGVNEEYVFRLLVHEGFAEDYAREIAKIFGHLNGFQRTHLFP